MLGMLMPRRPSASAGLATAPRLDVALGTDSSPATAVTLLSELLRPEAAPCVASTTADRDSGWILPVVSGVARSIDGTDLLSAAPVDATLTFGSDRLRAETEDVEFSGEIELPADEGAPCLGSMLAVPSSPRTRTFNSEPLLPREMLR